MNIEKNPVISLEYKTEEPLYPTIPFAEPIDHNEHDILYPLIDRPSVPVTVVSDPYWMPVKNMILPDEIAKRDKQKGKFLPYVDVMYNGKKYRVINHFTRNPRMIKIENGYFQVVDINTDGTTTSHINEEQFDRIKSQGTDKLNSWNDI